MHDRRPRAADSVTGLVPTSVNVLDRAGVPYVQRTVPPRTRGIRWRALRVVAAGTLLLISVNACEEALSAKTERPPPAQQLPELSIADSSAGEGSGSLAFEVTLSPASTQRVTVRYATADGTAAAGEDYTSASGTLTFAGGSRKQTIMVTIVADGRDEPGVETFTVTLSEARNAVLGTATATGNILDDDVKMSLVADAPTVAEGAAATFTVSVAGGPVTAPLEARYEVGGTAQAGGDYVLPSPMLVLDAGARSGTITIQTLADAVLEPPETLVLTLLDSNSASDGVELDPAAAKTTILDVGMVTVSVAAESAAVAEGGRARFVAELTGAVASPVALSWATADGTATAGADYAAVRDGTLTFRSGAALRRVLEVATLQDNLTESDETFSVTLDAAGLPRGVALGQATATVTIRDDDPSGDDHGNTPAAATGIAPGTTVSGRLESATDVDYFRLTVTTTGTLIAATDPGIEDYAPTAVAIEGPDGATPSADHYAELSPAAPGTYYVRVAGTTATRYDLAVLLFDPTAEDRSFDIDLRFLGTEATPGQARTIRAAADTWERVITRGLPPRNVLASDAWQCEPGDPSLFGVHIDDLLINIRMQPIDGPGAVLAVAGPCRVRAENGLPYLGDVLFDTADLLTLEQAGVLGDTALHEMAHVLGFGLGSLWDGLLAQPSVGSFGAEVSGQDTHFRGAAAVAAFDRAGGTSYAGRKVPVENDTSRYGRGALDTHWRESVFGAELMTTAVVIEDGTEPLSEVTIAALADLGYQVDYRGAQRYRLPPATSLRQSARGAVRAFHLYNDVRQGPIRVD